MRFFSEEHRRRISESKKGKVPSIEARENMRIAAIGRKHSEATKEKIRLANIGKVMSPESIAKARVHRIGVVRTIESRRKQSIAIKGRKKSPEHIAKMVAGRKRYYEVHPEEWKEEISKLSRYQDSLTPEQRSSRSMAGRLACMSAMKDRKRTSIEELVGRELDRIGIEYIEQLPIGYYSVDFYLSRYGCVIECDGDYWHSTEKVKSRDAKKDRFLTGKGIEVYRITETDINKDVVSSVSSVMNGVVNGHRHNTL